MGIAEHRGYGMFFASLLGGVVWCCRIERCPRAQQL